VAMRDKEREEREDCGYGKGGGGEGLRSIDTHHEMGGYIVFSLNEKREAISKRN